MTEMTLDEFIAEVKSLGLTWRFEGYGVAGAGRLRCAIGDCPITAVANARLKRQGKSDRWNNYTAGTAAQLDLGLPPRLASQIMNAADGYAADGIRQRLIEELHPRRT